jgi:DNA mismatch repair protein MutS
MAQCGCFVAAEAADLCIIDKLFCRVGASDNIVLGRSTFLTEMIEAANILNNCTPQSLVLLDEIGRGTSTYDGLSIAWAITEFLHDEKKHRAKTIFATHYHELTILESMFERIKNFQVMVQKNNEMIKFLHRISKGGCDDSYGVYVAKLAGIPDSVLARARELLITLEKGEVPDTHSRRIAGLKGQRKKVNQLQIDLFEPEYHPLVIELQELKLDNMTPIKALELLYDWSKKWGQLR